jgi:UDP-N-acetylmuramoylalanine-D-glutamate ligase
MANLLILPAKSFGGPISLPSKNHFLAMHVLIGGVGVAGLTLACFPTKAGAHITIVEKSKALFPQGKNVDLQGSAVIVVSRM